MTSRKVDKYIYQIRRPIKIDLYLVLLDALGFGLGAASTSVSKLDLVILLEACSGSWSASTDTVVSLAAALPFRPLVLAGLDTTSVVSRILTPEMSLSALVVILVARVALGAGSGLVSVMVELVMVSLAAALPLLPPFLVAFLPGV